MENRMVNLQSPITYSKLVNLEDMMLVFAGKPTLPSKMVLFKILVIKFLLTNQFITF